jgi:hypothetical protein
MALANVQIIPGVDREGTASTAEGKWYESDKVRFRGGYPESIGGWEKYTEDTFRGVARAMHNWTSVAGTTYMGMGTHWKYYGVIGGKIYDITPVRETDPLLTDSIDVVSGSTTVTINDIAHLALDNAFVTLSGSTAVGGVPADEINAHHKIQVVDDDSYTIEVTTAATSSVSGGGASISAEYLINPGLNVYIPATGWGAGAFGAGPFGSATALDAFNQLRLWGGDNYGNDFIFNARGGQVFYWDDPAEVTPPDRAVEISTKGGASNTPTICLQILNSDIDRHVIAFGTNNIGESVLDPLLIRWSDRENALDWTPTAVNTSGGRRLTSGSYIVGVVKTRQEFLVWTDSSLHSMRFVGGDLVYDLAVVEEGVSMMGPLAAINADGIVYYMDKGGFWIYNGSIEPLPCSLRDHVFSDMNKSQSYKIFASTNTDFHEVSWHYPSASSGDVDRYVTYNYVDRVWYGGTLSRTKWLDVGSRKNPIAAGDNGTGDNNYLYSHDQGYSADGEDLTSYIETGDLDIEDGEHFAFISRILPDVKWRGTSGSASLTVTVKGRRFPLNALKVLATKVVTAVTGQTKLRARARQFVFRFSSTTKEFGWRLGVVKVDSKKDGKR